MTDLTSHTVPPQMWSIYDEPSCHGEGCIHRIGTAMVIFSAMTIPIGSL